MSEDVTAKRVEAHFSQPFVPFKGNPGGPDSPATLRMAVALEYIAAQLGKINERFERSEKAQLKVAEDLGKEMLARQGKRGIPLP